MNKLRQIEFNQKQHFLGKILNIFLRKKRKIDDFKNLNNQPLKTRKRFVIKFSRLTFILIILLIGLLGYLLLDYFPVFKINRLTFSPPQINCASKEQLVLRSNLKNKNILFFDDEKFSKTLQKNFLCIKHAEFVKKLPDHMVVNIQERHSVAQLTKTGHRKLDLEVSDATPSTPEAKLDFLITDPSEQTFIIDSQSFVFGQRTEIEPDLPHIYIAEKNLELGKTVENFNITGVLMILNTLKDLQVDIKSAKVVDSDLFVDAAIKIAFSLDNDIKKQQASLQLLLQKAKIDSKSIEIIDLRFSKPVIVYSSKKG